MPDAAILPTTAKRNVELITQAEEQLLRGRPRAERLGEWVASFFGSFRFIAAHVAVFAGWMLYNAGVVPGVRPFDPYPFNFLALLVGVEFILLTTFVLMNQERQMRRSEQWAHLTLQTCLLAEQEGTKNMEMLRLVCHQLGLDKPAGDLEVKELAQATDVAALVEEIGKARQVGERLVEEIGQVCEGVRTPR